MNQHLTAAQEAAGLDYPGLLARVCIVQPTGRDAAAGRRRAEGANRLTPAAAAPPTESVPPREEWYQEPRRIFDNFYWVGNRRNNAWVIKTSAGLITVLTECAEAEKARLMEGGDAIRQENTRQCTSVRDFDQLEGPAGTVLFSSSAGGETAVASDTP